MLDNSWTPAFDVRPLNARQRILVVGCGRHPPIDHGPHHCLPREGGVDDWEIDMDDAYTMDVDTRMSPDRIGSFWVADHVEDLPSGRFDAVFFENLPAPLFQTGGWAHIAAKNAFRLLAPHGWVYIRTGADKSVMGPIYPALTEAHFINVSPTYLSNGALVDICAQKP